MENKLEITEKIALSMVRGVNAGVVRALDEAGITPSEFLRADSSAISEAIGLKRPDAFPLSVRDEAFIRARREVGLLEKFGGKALFILDNDYPWSLREAHDAPVVLYQIGDYDINSSSHSLSVVGTRRASAYGMSLTRKLIEDLACYFPDLLVVSGLAYGIDSAGHRAALDSGSVTVAVLGTSFKKIYPADHAHLAREIVDKGGAVLTEYPYDTAVYQNSFLARNRIVAALTPLTVVAECPDRSGAMNTANTANSYDRQVAAFPARVGDENSSGCLTLIRTHKASLITGAADVVELMGWKPLGRSIDTSARNLFPEIAGDAKTVYDLLVAMRQPLNIDVIHRHTSVPIATLMNLLTELEFDGLVNRLPGNRYEKA